jgi:hypothetical protein
MIRVGDKLVRRTFEPGLVGYLVEDRWAIYRFPPPGRIPTGSFVAGVFEGYRDVDPADLRAVEEMREGLRPWDDLAA